jgi:hypothetical protein
VVWEMRRRMGFQLSFDPDPIELVGCTSREDYDFVDNVVRLKLSVVYDLRIFAQRLSRPKKIVKSPSSTSKL